MKTLFFLFLYGTLASQVDTIITTPAYTSYYSFSLKAPIMVKYFLTKGGGDCPREQFHFKAEPFTACNKDYLHSGYDKGHLVPAEDFAYSCDLGKLTFNYCNCMPQLPELNRGPWEVLENNIRTLSQTDSLIILCGGFYNNTKIGSGISVPDTCWKIVYDITTKSFLTGYMFTNTRRPKQIPVKVEDLKMILKNRYGITISK